MNATYQQAVRTRAFVLVYSPLGKECMEPLTNEVHRLRNCQCRGAL